MLIMEARAVLVNQKYDILDDMVEDIHKKCIRMDYEEEQALNERFLRVIDKFIRNMKKVDQLFNLVYNRIGYTGSFYDGLRVGEATEYDLNLILDPKKLKKDLKIITVKDGCPPGFISVLVKDEYLPQLFMQHWVSADGNKVLLDSNLVMHWLQSVVHRALTKYQDEAGCCDDCKITAVCRSGPAWTLVIVSDKEPVKTICVDLVPVFEFPSSQCPVYRIELGSFNETWFVVPKPSGYYSTDWRLSFPIQETEMIKGLDYLKYTLRLLKRVRDQLEFTAIASYYIKTLFLWEVQKQNNNIWSRSRRGRLFIYMLIRLKEALEDEQIPFFWDGRCNLIRQVNSDCLSNFCNRLKRFLKIIDNCIDHKEHEQLEYFIRQSLSTPSEQQSDSGWSCTIL